MSITAERIKQLRKKKGLSQSELAELVGVKNNTVSTWERGTRKPDFEALDRLSEVFETSFEYILGSSDNDVARAKPTIEQLDELALSALADELAESVKKYCQLGAKSQKLISQMIDSAYKLDKEDGELNEEVFKVTIITGCNKKM